MENETHVWSTKFSLKNVIEKYGHKKWFKHSDKIWSLINNMNASSFQYSVLISKRKLKVGHWYILDMRGMQIPSCWTIRHVKQKYDSA